jgi:hypothetical protein
LKPIISRNPYFFSRDEKKKQDDMRNFIKNDKIKYFIGDG